MKKAGTTRSIRLRHRRLPTVMMGVLATVCVLCLHWASGERGNLVGALDDMVFQGVFPHRSWAWRSVSQSPAFKQALRDVVVVAIDEDTLKDPRFHEWPLPRRRYAEMIEFLEKAGVGAIAIDIRMDERQSAFPGSDEILGKVLDRYDNVILAGTVAADAAGRHVFKEPVFAGKWDTRTRQARVGMVWIDENEVRAVPLVFDLGSDVRYSWDLLLAARGRKTVVDRSQVTSSRGWLEGAVTLGDVRVPVQAGRLHVNYFFGSSLEEANVDPVNLDASAPQNNVKYIPFAAIWDMTHEDRVDFFKDRLVLLGVTALAGADIQGTPRGRMPGLDIHLNIVLSLLSGEFLHIFGGIGPTLVSVLVALLVAASVAFMGVRWGAVVTCLVGGAIVWWIPMHLGLKGLFFPPGMPAAAIVLSYTLSSVLKAVQEQRTTERLTRLIKEVAPMPDEFIEKYVASPGAGLKLGGRKVYVSVLFTDIRGYTDMSERMDPVTVMNTLNVFYTEMGNIVHRHGGGILDYVGDAQLVVFGLDAEHATNHADAAVEAALGMIERLDELNEIWAREQETQIEIGIGICTGDVSIGMMGSGQHKQYSAIGDTTNVAARLQSLSKELGSLLIVSESTRGELRKSYPFEKVTGVKVKGKAEPMTVHRLLMEVPSKKAEAS